MDDVLGFQLDWQEAIPSERAFKANPGRYIDTAVFDIIKINAEKSTGYFACKIGWVNSTKACETCGFKSDDCTRTWEMKPSFLKKWIITKAPILDVCPSIHGGVSLQDGNFVLYDTKFGKVVGHPQNCRHLILSSDYSVSVQKLSFVDNVIATLVSLQTGDFTMFSPYILAKATEEPEFLLGLAGEIKDAIYHSVDIYRRYYYAYHYLFIASRIILIGRVAVARKQLLRELDEMKDLVIMAITMASRFKNDHDVIRETKMRFLSFFPVEWARVAYSNSKLCLHDYHGGAITSVYRFERRAVRG